MDKRQCEIIIHLVGTKGQLDKPEMDYSVYPIEKVAERAKEMILSYKNKFPNVGCSMP